MFCVWGWLLFLRSECWALWESEAVAHVFYKPREGWGRQGISLPFCLRNSLEDYIYPGHGHFLYGFVAGFGFLSSLYLIPVEGGVPEVTTFCFPDTSLLARVPPWHGLSQHIVNNSITYYSVGTQWGFYLKTTASIIIYVLWKSKEVKKRGRGRKKRKGRVGRRKTFTEESGIES